MSNKAILGAYESYLPLFFLLLGEFPILLSIEMSEKGGTLGTLLEGSGYIGDECGVKNHH